MNVTTLSMCIKRNITSLLKAILTKIHYIKSNPIWIQISYSTLYEAHLIKTLSKECLCQKGEKCSEITKGIFFFSPPQKSEKLLFEHLHGVKNKRKKERNDNWTRPSTYANMTQAELTIMSCF